MGQMNIGRGVRAKKVNDTLKIWLEKAVTIFENAFRVTCIVAAVAMCIYCTIDYMRDDDLTEVSFVKFHGTGMNTYPEVSLCFSSHYSDSELKKINENFSTNSYFKFLRGESWDSRMVGLDYDKITTKLEDHLLHICAQSVFRGRCDVNFDVSNHVYLWGTQCLSFQASPSNQMFEASMWINNSIFVNDGIKPHSAYKFVVALSYPKQILRYSHHFARWQIRTPIDKYALAFKLSDVEIIRRRNKPREQCSDWKNYDTIVENQALSYAGCRLFNRQITSNDN